MVVVVRKDATPTEREAIARTLLASGHALPEPVESPQGAQLYLDAHLAEHETVVFSAGTHTDSIRMRVSDLRTLGTHTIVEVCQTAS